MSLSVASQANAGGGIIFAHGREEDVRTFAAVLTRSYPDVHFEAHANGLDCLHCLGSGSGSLTAPMPWLCVLDYHLPGVDGMYLLGRIRSDPLLHRVPVVLLGREGDVDIVMPAYATGANACMLLPNDETARAQFWEELLNYWLCTVTSPLGRRMGTKLTPERTSRAGEECMLTAATDSGRAVLIGITEDSPDDRVMMQCALRDCGISNPVVFLEDGEKLLHYLRRSGPFAELSGVTLPGLVLLDFNMPRMDGRAALAEIKQDPELRHVPVAVLSSAYSPADVSMSYDMGANSFLAKPDTYDELLALVRSIDRYWLHTATCPRAPGALPG